MIKIPRDIYKGNKNVAKLIEDKVSNTDLTISSNARYLSGWLRGVKTPEKDPKVRDAIEKLRLMVKNYE